MKAKMKEIFRYSKLSIAMCIILLVGVCFYSSTAIGIPIKEKLIIFLVCFIPFFVFLIITILSCYFIERYEKIIKTITFILSILLATYYSIVLFVCVLLVTTNPVTDSKYYNHYVKGDKLEKVFPAKIPSNVKNVEFYYALGFLQGGTELALYYIDKNMTLDKFNSIYKSNAEWIGHIKDYNEKDGLLSGAFSNTPSQYKNEDDFIIYLVDSSCYMPDSCNHGDFLFAAFNEKTNEVIFKLEDW